MEKVEEKRFKILTFVFAGSGHNIPFYPIINELKTKHKTIDVIVYSAENYKTKFENVGAVFKPIQFDEQKLLPVLPEGNKKDFLLFFMLSKLIQVTSDNVDYLAREIDNENPDLIIYDMTLPGKYFFMIHDYYQKCYEQNDQDHQNSFKPKHKLPPLVGYSPSFCQQMNVYPNKVEMSKFSENTNLFSFRVLWQILVFLFVHFKFCFKFGLGFVNPFKSLLRVTLPNTKFTITTVFPELQPRFNLFDKENKFVGSTINESINNAVVYSSLKDDSVKNILETFKIKDNKVNILDDDDDQKLIYVSLGTTFNDKLEIFKMIFEAFKAFDLEPNETKSKIRSKNIKLLVSLGDKCYAKLQELLNKKDYLLPDNIVLVKMSPQTEILKRASLFVTHCGMNSTSESIHYGGKVFFKLLF